jgi:micrococcal nuclease
VTSDSSPHRNAPSGNLFRRFFMKKSSYLAILLGILISSIIIFTGCSELQDTAVTVDKPIESSNPQETVSLEEAKITRVIDGDTVELSDGRRLRMIGINTPENTSKTEPYGKEASDYTKSMLTGKTVFLEKDVSDVDRYGRLLRIIWLEKPSDISDSEIREKMFNAILILGGYAEPYTFPPDVKYSKDFVKYAKEARAQKTSLWSIYPEKGTTRRDLD